MPALGPWELIVILLIVVVVFGAGRLSEVGGAVGKSIREFRKATTDPAAEANAANPAATLNPPVANAPIAAAPIAQPLAANAAPSTAATATATENKCPSCATVNPTGQVFCGQCGARLTRAA